MPEFKPTKPDYDVSALKKSTSEKGNVGKAWKLTNGQIRIKLNPFVVLEGEEDLVLTMFPTTNKPTTRSVESTDYTNPDYHNDEIPF